MAVTQGRPRPAPPHHSSGNTGTAARIDERSSSRARATQPRRLRSRRPDTSVSGPRRDLCCRTRGFCLLSVSNQGLTAPSDHAPPTARRDPGQDKLSGQHGAARVLSPGRSSDARSAPCGGRRSPFESRGMLKQEYDQSFGYERRSLCNDRPHGTSPGTGRYFPGT